MGSLTDYAELELLDHVFENGAYTPASTMYVGLLTADPTDTGSQTNEASGNGYARTAITFAAAATREVVQSGQVTFPQCTGGGWGILTHWGIFDASTGGNMLAHGALTTSIATVDGNVVYIPDATVEISVNSGAVSNYLAHALLDFMFRNQAYAQPNCHVGLCSAAPVDTDDGSTITELSGGAYARVDFADWTTAAAGALSNNTDITFTTPTADWTTVTHSVICDASSAGNLLVYATATPNQAPLTGDPVKFLAGNYDVTMD
jgi:hypothetical protein